MALKAVTILRNNLNDPSQPLPPPPTPGLSSKPSISPTPESFFTEIESALEQTGLSRQTIKKQVSAQHPPNNQTQNLNPVTITTEKEFVLWDKESVESVLPPSSPSPSHPSKPSSPPSSSSSSTWGFDPELTIDIASSVSVPPEAGSEEVDEPISQLCIICHSPVAVPGTSTTNLTLGLEYVSCPNLHYLHYDCVKKWLERSSKCPVCHEQYDKGVLDEFASYIEAQKKEKEEANLVISTR